MTRGITIDVEVADRIVRRYIDPNLGVTAVRRLHGGMMHRVRDLKTNGTPSDIIAKLNHSDKLQSFKREAHTLAWYRSGTELPVPEPYAVAEPFDDIDLAGVLMQKMPGVTLADSRLSPRGVKHFQIELARHLAALHSHTRETFGGAIDADNYTTWVGTFAPMIEAEFFAVRDQLSSRCRETVGSLIGNLDRWLDNHPVPRLVHGDLWATNILVDDSHSDKPTITAFIDCTATYCDAEYELAYLLLFKTAGDTFFDVYHSVHPRRPGFEQRCLVYWLNTMLLHVRLFGGRYLSACEDLARQIARH